MSALLPEIEKKSSLEIEQFQEKKMIVFCCNVEHAIKTTIQLNESGYRAKFIASEKGKPKEVQSTIFGMDMSDYLTNKLK